MSTRNIWKIEVDSLTGHRMWKLSAKGEKRVFYAKKWCMIVGHPVRDFFKGGAWEFKLVAWDKNLHGLA